MTRIRATAAILAAVLALGACATSEARQAKGKEKDPRYQYNLGLFYLNSQGTESASQSLQMAVRHFERSIALDPRFAPAWNALGLARAMRGELPAAIEAHRKTLEIDPLYTEAHNNLGTLYQETGDLKRAESEFRQVLLDPKYRTRELPLYNLARLCLDSGRDDEALNFADQAIQANASFGLGHAMKGLVLQRMKDYSGAMSAFRAAMRKAPSEPTFTFGLAESCFQAGELEEAEELFTRLRDKTTDQALRAKIEDYLRQIREKK